MKTDKNVIDLYSFLSNCCDNTLILEIDNCLEHLKKFEIKCDKEVFQFWMTRLSILNEEIKSREQWRGEKLKE